MLNNRLLSPRLWVAVFPPPFPAVLRWALSLLPLLLLSCTEADLCYDAEHPHRAKVSFDFDCQEWRSDSTRCPDSMMIAAIRVVNLWKCGVNISTRDYTGFYFYNEPATIPEWADPYAELPEPEPVIPDATQIDLGSIGITPEPPAPVVPDPPLPFQYFALRQGTYKFLTLNKDNYEVNDGDVYRYMDAQGQEMQITDINVTYRTFEGGDTLLRSVFEGFVDYNPGFPYIQPEAKPLYFDTLTLSNIYLNTVDNHFTFHPKRITQNIDIYLTITKDLTMGGLVVDSVIGEVAGIPLTIGVTSQNLDVRRTAKQMFHTEFVDDNRQPMTTPDQMTADHVNLHTNLNVVSLVNSSSELDVTGPGIMQLVIWTHTVDDSGNIRHKTMQGRLNMHNALKKSKLITYSDDGQRASQTASHGEVVLEHKIVLDRNTILEASDDTGGIKEWQPGTGDVTPVEL